MNTVDSLSRVDASAEAVLAVESDPRSNQQPENEQANEKDGKMLTG